MKLILLIPLIIFMTGCNPDDKDNSSDSAVLTGEAIYNKNYPRQIKQTIAYEKAYKST